MACPSGWGGREACWRGCPREPEEDVGWGNMVGGSGKLSEGNFQKEETERPKFARGQWPELKLEREMRVQDCRALQKIWTLY